MGRCKHVVANANIPQLQPQHAGLRLWLLGMQCMHGGHATSREMQGRLPCSPGPEHDWRGARFTLSKPLLRPLPLRSLFLRNANATRWMEREERGRNLDQSHSLQNARSCSQTLSLPFDVQVGRAETLVQHAAALTDDEVIHVIH